MERLQGDSAHGADSLPLLSLTLARLYEDYGSTGELTVDGYEAMGGMNHVVQTQIDSVLARDPTVRESQLDRLHRAFIPWLATINPDNDQPMRRVARRSDLPANARLEIDALVSTRLLVQSERDGEVFVEVALESLLRQWADLAGWLAAERDDLKEADNLERAAVAWEQNDRNDAWLLEGGRLSRSESLVSKPGFQDRLSHTSGFLAASRAREDKRSADEEKRKVAELRAAQEKQQVAEAHAATLRRRSQILRVVLAATVVIALVAIAGFVWASNAQRDGHGSGPRGNGTAVGGRRPGDACWCPAGRRTARDAADAGGTGPEANPGRRAGRRQLGGGAARRRQDDQGRIAGPERGGPSGGHRVRHRARRMVPYGCGTPTPVNR